MALATVVGIATVAAALANIGSLLAVAWQLKSLARQTSEAARQAQTSAEAIQASVYMTAQEKAVDVDRLFIEYPEIRQRFYGQIPKRGNQVELHRLDATAEMLMDVYDLVIAHRHRLPAAFVEGWSAYMDEMMSKSLPLREFWARNRDWYAALDDALGDRWSAISPPAVSEMDSG